MQLILNTLCSTPTVRAANFELHCVQHLLLVLLILNALCSTPTVRAVNFELHCIQHLLFVLLILITLYSTHTGRATNFNYIIFNTYWSCSLRTDILDRSRGHTSQSRDHKNFLQDTFCQCTAWYIPYRIYIPNIL